MPHCGNIVAAHDTLPPLPVAIANTHRSRLAALPSRLATSQPRSPQPFTPTESERTRGSTWMRIREQVLGAAGGLCQCDECADLGRIRLASQVDHYVPLWKGGTDDPANLRAINVDCHERKSAREAAERSRG